MLRGSPRTHGESLCKRDDIVVPPLAQGRLKDMAARTLLLIQAFASPFTAVLDHSRYVNYAKQKPMRAL